jgi:ribonuclease R
VKLVEAAPVAGALRFELLSEGRFHGKAAKKPRGDGAGRARRKTTPRLKQKNARRDKQEPAWSPLDE